MPRKRGAPLSLRREPSVHFLDQPAQTDALGRSESTDVSAPTSRSTPRAAWATRSARSARPTAARSAAARLRRRLGLRHGAAVVAHEAGRLVAEHLLVGVD